MLIFHHNFLDHSRDCSALHVHVCQALAVSAFFVFPQFFIKNLNLRLATTWKYALGVLSLRGKVFNGRKCYCHRRSVMDIEKLMRIPLSTDIWRVQIHLINILHAKQSYYIQPLLQINLQLTGLCSHIIFIDS